MGPKIPNYIGEIILELIVAEIKRRRLLYQRNKGSSRERGHLWVLIPPWGGALVAINGKFIRKIRSARRGRLYYLCGDNGGNVSPINKADLYGRQLASSMAVILTEVCPLKWFSGYNALHMYVHAVNILRLYCLLGVSGRIVNCRN